MKKFIIFLFFLFSSFYFFPFSFVNASDDVWTAWSSFSSTPLPFSYRVPFHSYADSGSTLPTNTYYCDFRTNSTTLTCKNAFWVNVFSSTIVSYSTLPLIYDFKYYKYTIYSNGSNSSHILAFNKVTSQFFYSANFYNYWLSFSLASNSIAWGGITYWCIDTPWLTPDTFSYALSDIIDNNDFLQDGPPWCYSSFVTTYWTNYSYNNLQSFLYSSWYLYKIDNNLNELQKISLSLTGSFVTNTYNIGPEYKNYNTVIWSVNNYIYITSFSSNSSLSFTIYCDYNLSICNKVNNKYTFSSFGWVAYTFDTNDDTIDSYYISKFYVYKNWATFYKLRVNYNSPYNSYYSPITSISSLWKFCENKKSNVSSLLLSKDYGLFSSNYNISNIIYSWTTVSLYSTWFNNILTFSWFSSSEFRSSTWLILDFEKLKNSINWKTFWQLHFNNYLFKNWEFIYNIPGSWVNGFQINTLWFDKINYKIYGSNDNINYVFQWDFTSTDKYSYIPTLNNKKYTYFKFVFLDWFKLSWYDINNFIFVNAEYWYKTYQVCDNWDWTYTVNNENVDNKTYNDLINWKDSDLSNWENDYICSWWLTDLTKPFCWINWINNFLTNLPIVSSLIDKIKTLFSFLDFSVNSVNSFTLLLPFNSDLSASVVTFNINNYTPTVLNSNLNNYNSSVLYDNNFWLIDLGCLIFALILYFVACALFIASLFWFFSFIFSLLFFLVNKVSFWIFWHWIKLEMLTWKSSIFVLMFFFWTIFLSVFSLYTLLIAPYINELSEIYQNYKNILASILDYLLFIFSDYNKLFFIDIVNNISWIFNWLYLVIILYLLYTKFWRLF